MLDGEPRRDRIVVRIVPATRDGSRHQHADRQRSLEKDHRAKLDHHSHADWFPVPMIDRRVQHEEGDHENLLVNPRRLPSLSDSEAKTTHSQKLENE